MSDDDDKQARVEALGRAPTPDMPAPGEPPVVATGIPEATRRDEPEHIPPAETKPEALPTHPPKPADPEGTNTPSSPAGPGKPIDGHPAVNTYTPEATQKAEFEAGIQDWQSAVATKPFEVDQPEVGTKPKDWDKATDA